MDGLQRKEAWQSNVDHYVNMLLMWFGGHEMNVNVVEHEKRRTKQMQMIHHTHPIREQVVFLPIE